jgi:hypothetical protein
MLGQSPRVSTPGQMFGGLEDWMTYNQLVHVVEREVERLGYDELDAFADEQRRVLVWRVAQFIELGFGSDEAVALAYGAIDIGCARKLITQGCPPQTAAGILL